jgi:TolB protein
VIAADMAGAEIKAFLSDGGTGHAVRLGKQAKDISRREVLLGGGTLACVGMQSARAAAGVADTDGFAEVPPVAVSDFVAGTPDEVDDARTICLIVATNLERCGLLAQNAAALIRRSYAVDTPLCFPDMSAPAARVLITGRVTRRPDGRVHAEFCLWNAVLGLHLGHPEHVAPQRDARRIGHLISDAVHERLTGEPGYFDSRIVFVDEIGSLERQITRLAIMDQDGANLHYLTRAEATVYGPRFSPSGRHVAYAAAAKAGARVQILDLETGRREMVGNFPGMAFSPCFSPDGRTLAMSVGSDGNGANLFAIDLGSKAITRLTSGLAIDTCASYSPDGRKICFESDRDGRRNVYVMSSGGGPAQPIDPGPSNRCTPAWSPRGDMIAFTAFADGRSTIGTMGQDGSRERILSTGFGDDDPRFAPNGRGVIFTRARRPPRSDALVAIDLTSHDEFTVPTPNAASQPDWAVQP